MLQLARRRGIAITRSPGFSPCILPAALSGLALAIRLYRLGEQSLWLDEAFTLWRAGLPMPSLLSAGDTHPYLYYLLFRYWAQLGSGEFFYRLPSAVLGSIAVGLVYWLGKLLAGRRVAVGAAALLALSPLHVWYSQEARMYAMAGTLALASLVFFVRYLQRPRPADLLVGTAFMGLGLVTDYPLLVVWMGEGLAAVGALTLSRRWLALAAWLGAQIALLVALYDVLAEMWVLLKHWDTSSFTGLRLRALVDSLLLDQTPWYAFIVLCLAIMAAAGVICLFIRRRVGNGSPLRLGQATAAVGVALVLGVSVVSLWPGGQSIKRQFLVLVPLAMLLGAWGLRLWPRWRSAVVAAVVLLSLVGLFQVYWVNQKEQWREMVALLEAQAGPRDVIWLHGDSIFMPFGVYYRGQAPFRSVLPAQLPYPELSPPVERLWLVISHEWDVDPDRSVEAALDRRLLLESESRFQGIRLRLYRVPDGLWDGNRRDSTSFAGTCGAC